MAKPTHRSSSHVDIPKHPEPPRAYTPPPTAMSRPFKLIDWAGIAAVISILLFLMIWLGTSPASGEKSYYDLLLSRDITKNADHAADEPAGH